MMAFSQIKCKKVLTRHDQKKLKGGNDDDIIIVDAEEL